MYYTFRLNGKIELLNAKAYKFTLLYIYCKGKYT